MFCLHVLSAAPHRRQPPERIVVVGQHSGLVWGRNVREGLQSEAITFRLIIPLEGVLLERALKQLVRHRSEHVKCEGTPETVWMDQAPDV